MKTIKFGETFFKTIQGIQFKITVINGYTAKISCAQQICFHNCMTNERQLSNNEILFKANKGNVIKVNNIFIDFNHILNKPFVYFYNNLNNVVIYE